MAVTIKSEKEIEILRSGGKRLARIMQELIARAAPGISTLELDHIAQNLILKCGGRSSFKDYRSKETKIPYPAFICASLNDEVVHGIPKKEAVLKNGDLLSIDLGMRWPASGEDAEKNSQGLFTDMAFTIAIGFISKNGQRLLQGTKEALDAGIAAIRPDVHLGDISHAIETRLKEYGLGVVRDLAGHGVGYAVHENPLIPNYGAPGQGLILKKGMVLAIEPMATLGEGVINLADDRWMYRTLDHSLAAHFEHTVAVTSDGAEILTSPR